MNQKEFSKLTRFKKRDYLFNDIKQQIVDNQRRLDTLWEMLNQNFPLPDTHYYTLKDNKVVVDYR